jgi:hypothetical protein
VPRAHGAVGPGTIVRGSCSRLSIVEKELIPIILGCAVWGHSWRGHQVVGHCDNQVFVACASALT